MILFAAIAALFNLASLDRQPGRLSRNERRRTGVGRLDPDRFGTPRVAPTTRAIRRRMTARHARVA